jgi:uncharacterized protein (TIGR03437 family)
VKRAAAFFALLAATCPLPAYYHFIHYLKSGNAPEKFDLSALNSNTVVVLVSEAGPSAYSATDSFNSVVNQILQATKVWDGVSSSALRIRFGGLENTATLRNVPGIDCVFEDLPPGLLGYGGPTSLDTAITTADGSQFIPITRSAMHLNLNLTIAPGPSYNESFFTTAVHEMGHTLGLQHTFTSAAMATATTRATNLTHPLGVDDVAGISLLYPNSLASNYGSITGKITAAGKPVHLQSIVAIRPGGDAVSAVSNPDGSYAITGLPPGDYYVYAHPLPPDANIYGPWDSSGNVVPASGPTNTLLYPGTTSLGDAQTVSVAAAAAVSGINFSLSPRSVVSIYDVGVYSFFNGQTAVKPADLNVNNGPASVSVSGVGLGSSGQAPGFGVQFMGGNVQLQPHGLLPYLASGYTYIGLNLGFLPNPALGPQHVAFSTSNDIYVLPNALNLTQSDPPSIAAASPNPDGSVTVTGANWAPDTLFYFDSLPASVNSLDPTSGSAVLTPPPPASSQTATLSAYNFDGQNSQLVGSSSPVTYSFPAAAAPAIASIAPTTIPAGSEAIVDVTATGITFIDGAASLGFGTPDILVRRVFVLSPTHILADVSILPGAAQTASDVSVLSGFQIATASAAFQVTAPVPGRPAAVPLLFNGISGLTGSYAGAVVSMYGRNLAASNAAPVLQIAGKTALIEYASPGQINFQIPSDLPPGLALLTLNNGVLNALPVVVNIDATPAGIGAIQRVSGAYIYAGHPGMLGETLIVSLDNFAPPNSTVALNRVQVGVGGVLRAPTKIVAATPAVFQVWFPLTAADSTGSSVQVVVYLDGRSSYPAQIPIMAPPSN